MPAHRIVAIDYDAQIGERLRAAFAPPEFDFHWFAAGREALENLQDLQPEAIICDVMLPDIDGRAVLDAVKRSPGLRDVPFLVLSGVRSEATIRATLDAGADAFLLKPFPVSQLVQTVRKVLRDTPDQDAGAPLGELQRPSGSSHGLAAVGRTGREGASLPSAARAPAHEATSRQRIGFETRDPLLEVPRPEPPATAGQALPSREDASPHPPEAGEAEDAAPIRLEGRFSSLELDGVRIRVVTEAEKGRSLVVRTTVTRDGKELRRVETKVDRSPESGADERSLRELIDLQHAGALQEISRLPMPVPRRPEEPLLPDLPEEGRRQEVPPVARGAASAEPADERAAPAESLPVERRAGVGGHKSARRSKEAARPSQTAKAKPRAGRRARRQPPVAVDTVVLKRAVEADPAPLERETLPAPDLSVVVPAPKATDPTVRSGWLAACAAVVVIAWGLVLNSQFRTTPAAKTPQPTLVTASRAPDAGSPAQAPPVEQASEPPGDIQQPAQVVRPSPAGLERIVRGRREWAQALYEAGRYDEASAALGEVFKLAPADREALRIAGQILRTPRAVASPGSNDAPLPSERRSEDPGVATDGTTLGDLRTVTEESSGGDPAGVAREEERRRAPPEQASREQQALKQLEAQKQAPSPEPEVEPGTMMDLSDPGVIAPIAERRLPLAYPRLAQRQRVEGTVELRVLVDETGAVMDAHVVRGPATKVGLGEAAVDNVKQWRFRPATKNGVPVKVWLPVRIEFRLPR